MEDKDIKLIKEIIKEYSTMDGLKEYTKALEKLLQAYKEDAISNILNELDRLKKENEKLKKENNRLIGENRRLKTIRYTTDFGTESIHLIPESDLVEINTNRYMIEIENGRFVDLKQVYQENEKLKDKLLDTLEGQKVIKEETPQYIKENYIPVEKVKEKIEELKQEKKKYGNCLIEMYEDELVNRDIKILQELLESEE